MTDTFESENNLKKEDVTFYANLALSIVNTFFTTLDTEIDNFPKDIPFNPILLFMAIGAHLTKILILSSKEINDKNNKLSHALFCGIADMLIKQKVSSKKRLKDIISKKDVL